jgi:hypothetical protein
MTCETDTEQDLFFIPPQNATSNSTEIFNRYQTRCSVTSFSEPLEISDTNGVLQQLLFVAEQSGVHIVDMGTEQVVYEKLQNNPAQFLRQIPADASEKTAYIVTGQGNKLYGWVIKFSTTVAVTQITVTLPNNLNMLGITGINMGSGDRYAVVLAGTGSDVSTVYFYKMSLSTLVLAQTWTILNPLPIVSIDSFKCMFISQVLTFRGRISSSATNNDTMFGDNKY